MTRRRTTWMDRKASAPPATPGYSEGSNHPAWPGADPDADKYMNGDPSSWAEDPHPGPYPNSTPPADPGMQEPQGHPATDPAHYFPGGARAASDRQIQAALEHKASKCIRLATSLLGKTASPSAIEDQALDFMSLNDRQIQAMLARVADSSKESNFTLTPARKADDLLADDLLVEDEDVIVPAAKKAEDESEEEPKKEAKKSEDEESEEPSAAKKAAHYARLANYWNSVAKKASGQNDPSTYNYTAGEDEDEKLLAEMMEEEAKKAASKKSEEDEDEDEKLLAEMEEEEAKKASKKSEDEESEEPKKEAKKSEDDEETASEDEESDKKANYFADEDPLMAEFDNDPMSMIDPMAEGLSEDEMAVVYGGRFASKKSEDEESEEPKKEAKKSEDEEEGADKKAALKPRPRTASTGPRTLGSVSANSRTASSEINELQKLWESAPDISKVF